ncbi:MAG TPA: nickel-dependent lactate racemase [Burkholderiales bacterium]|nr:nickel-dependent lactate racemase [Burkholderiales bacterium]
MQIDLNYGRDHYPLELSESWNVTVIRKPAMPVEGDSAAAVRRALASPVGAKPLAQEARGRKTACILICDITRPVPNGLLLPAIVHELLDAGIEARDITVLVATGLHRPNEGTELEELVGDPWVMKTVRVENHFARDDAAHVDLGRTPTRGTPVKLDRRFVQADVKIATGLVEPHFMAGYSGGRKVIAPGIAHRDTITTFHSARFMSHPQADNCVLEGNPLHEEQLEIVRMLGHVLAVNTVIDEHRRLSFVNYGEILASHQQAVDFTRRYARVPVPRRFRTVVTSAAGYPLDKTYYQTVKGMVGPVDILEPGGNLVIVSECSEGLGSPEYADAQRRLIRLGTDGFYADISRKQFADVDEWQTQMQLKPMKAGTVHLYTGGLAAADRALTGVSLTDSVERTLQHCIEESGDHALAVIPEGPYVVPYYQPA